MRSQKIKYCSLVSRAFIFASYIRGQFRMQPYNYSFNFSLSFKDVIQALIFCLRLHFKVFWNWPKSPDSTRCQGEESTTEEAIWFIMEHIRIPRFLRHRRPFWGSSTWEERRWNIDRYIYMIRFERLIHPSPLLRFFPFARWRVFCLHHSWISRRRPVWATSRVEVEDRRWHVRVIWGWRAIQAINLYN